MQTVTNTQIQAILTSDNYILTGSHVLPLRYCKDIDIICYQKDIAIETKGDEYIRSAEYEGVRYEFLLADHQESLRVLLESDSLIPEEIYYILKYGHIHIAGRDQQNWEKHIKDYHTLRLLVDYQDPGIQELCSLHYKTTNERIKQRTPTLKGKSKSDFFDDNVKKFIDHDIIHEIVAFDDKPAYTKMQKSDSVECSQDLWLAMSYEEQCQAVVEEAMVIAIERHILPFEIEGKMTKPPFPAFSWALYRICTTLCSGWFRRFAINNYFTCMNMWNKTKFDQAVKQVLTHIN